MDKFAPEVIERLKWYVYRLVDPRSGETFYVGKGKGNRVFQHAKGALSASDDEDATDLKSQRIKDIGAAGLEVAHVIHRHGIESEDVAFQIEGAVLDAYPGLTNQVGGHGSGDYGVRHAVEIVAEYTAEPFEAREPLILISIGKTYDDKDRSIYEAVRGTWVINPRGLVSISSSSRTGVGSSSASSARPNGCPQQWPIFLGTSGTKTAGDL